MVTVMDKGYWNGILINLGTMIFIILFFMVRLWQLDGIYNLLGW